MRKINIRDILILFLICIVFTGISFAADPTFEMSEEYYSGSELPADITITSDQSSFSSNSAPVLVDSESTGHALVLKEDSADSIVVTIPSGLEDGTYELRVGDPSAPTQDGGGKYYEIGTFYIADAQVLTDAPVTNLAKAYNESVDATMETKYSNLTSGQTVIDLMSGGEVSNSISPNSVSAVDSSFTQEMEFTVPVGLSSGDYDVKITTGDEEITFTNGIKVRGVASIVSDVEELNEGYESQDITITGTNTLFSGLTSVKVLDSDGEDMNKVLSVDVSDGTELIFTLDDGLSVESGQASYTIKVKTGEEEATTTFTLNAASGVIKNDDETSEVSTVGSSEKTVDLKLIGTNTDFSEGETEVSLLDSDGNVVSGKLSSVVVNGSSEIEFTLSKDLSVGTYTIKAATGSQSVEDTIEVVAPSIKSVSIESSVYNDQKNAVYTGYTFIKVTVEGQYTNFTNDTVIKVNDSTDNILSKNVIDTENIEFNIATDLAVGSYDIEISLNGGALEELTSFDIVEDSISDLTPVSLVNVSDDERSMTVTGPDTLFGIEGITTEVKLKNSSGIPAGDISDISASAESLTFNVIPSSLETGVYDLEVIVTKGSFSETLTKSDALTVVDKGIDSISPENIFKDQGSVDLTIVGEGTSFDEGTRVKIDDESVSLDDITIDSGTQLTLTLSEDLAVGTHSLDVIDGDPLQTTSFEIKASRSVSLEDSTIRIDYTEAQLVATAQSIDFDGNIPTVTLIKSDASEEVLDSENLEVMQNSNQLMITLPTGLPVGSYQVKLEWDSGIHSDVDFTKDFDIDHKYKEVLFEIGGERATTLTKKTNSDAVTFVVQGINISDDSYTDITDKAEVVIEEGSDVVSISNDSITFDSAGSATIKASYDGNDVTLLVTVLEVETVSEDDDDDDTDDSGDTVQTDKTVTKEDEEIEAKDLGNAIKDQTGKSAEKTVASVTNKVKAALEKEVTEENKKEVKDISKAIDKLIDREDITYTQAADITKNLIKDNISKILVDANTSSKEKDNYKKIATDLANKAIKKSGNMVLEEVEKIDKTALDKAIQALKTTSNTLKETLEESDVKNIEKVLKENITLKIPSENIELDKETITQLNDNKVGVAIGVPDGTEVELDKTILSKMKDKNIQVKSKKVSSQTNAVINKVAGDQYKVIKTNDIKVSAIDANGIAEDITNLKVSIDISDYVGNKDILSVILFNKADQKYERVSSWVQDNSIISRSPHYSFFTVAEYNNTFNDITKHWGEDTIIKMAAKGIVKGRSEEAFVPEDKITRAEFVKLLVEAFDIDATTEITYDDVAKTDWFYNYINAAIKEDLLRNVSGIQNYNFLPNQNITREDIVILMANTYKYETGEELSSDKKAFIDGYRASEKAKYAINAAHEYGFINGYPTGAFRPKGYSTRAEAIEILNNFITFLK